MHCWEETIKGRRNWYNGANNESRWVDEMKKERKKKTFSLRSLSLLMKVEKTLPNRRWPQSNCVKSSSSSQTIILFLGRLGSPFPFGQAEEEEEEKISNGWHHHHHRPLHAVGYILSVCIISLQVVQWARLYSRVVVIVQSSNWLARLSDDMCVLSLSLSLFFFFFFFFFFLFLFLLPSIESLSLHTHTDMHIP